MSSSGEPHSLRLTRRSWLQLVATAVAATSYASQAEADLRVLRPEDESTRDKSLRALLGSMRTCAQLVSYEVALALSVLGVVLMAGSLSLTEIVAAQGDALWYAVPQIVGLVVFIFAGTAETARAPFDLPEAEQELVAGYHTEYGGMRFGLYTMSEYINLITLSGLCVTLFLGGWHGPGWDGPSWLAPIWFLAKLVVLLYVFIWMRTTLPRLRYDQLMRFGWKVLLPVATVNAVVTAILVVAF